MAAILGDPPPVSDDDFPEFAEPPRFAPPPQATVQRAAREPKDVDEAQQSVVDDVITRLRKERADGKR